MAAGELAGRPSTEAMVSPSTEFNWIVPEGGGLPNLATARGASEAVGAGDPEEVFGVAFKWRVREDLVPFRALIEKLLGVGIALDCTCFNRAELRIISGEEAGVDHCTFNAPGCAQADDAVIVSFASFAAAFPAVHPFPMIGVPIGIKGRARGLDQVFDKGEILVADHFHIGTEKGARQIELLSKVTHIKHRECRKFMNVDSLPQNGRRCGEKREFPNSSE